MKSVITHRLPFVLVVAALVAGPLNSPAASARTPVLLELFTSEGCSSCPPADRLLQSLDKSQPIPEADLVVLSEHVDYWNHGGWSDPYSSPEFSQRQMDYAKTLRLDDIYTPQLVIDGAAELVGSNGAGVRSAVARAVTHNKLDIQLSNAARDGDHVSVHVLSPPLPAGITKSATIYLAIADNEDQSQVARGENAGRLLNHVAVVRTLKSVASLGNTGCSKDISLPFKSAATGGIRIVAFVQDQSSLRILAVTQIKL